MYTHQNTSTYRPICKVLVMFFFSCLALNRMSLLESTCKGLSCNGNFMERLSLHYVSTYRYFQAFFF